MKTIAAIQMCSSECVDDNLAQIDYLLGQASQSGTLLAVLPEMFPCIAQPSHPILTYKESPGQGKIQDYLSHLAQKYRLWIVAGTIPLEGKNPNKIRAACIIFDDQGKQVARYDKIHLFDAILSEKEKYLESLTTEPGEQITVIPTPVGKLGVAVCFDLRFPELFGAMSRLGAEIIAIPAAFTVPTGQAHWEVLMRCRALDSLAYVIGAGQGGTHSNGRKTYGHSMIVNPWGEILAEVKETGPGIAYAKIDLEQLYTIRKKLPVIVY
ncbi:MAG TPA: carbon-nitrogen hydrolase family protein [Legionellaceae bacterium]|nr:carbon-nitrogen hydrolase family protein [Legionellaceae bacterium]